MSPSTTAGATLRSKKAEKPVIETKSLLEQKHVTNDNLNRALLKE
jgi:hypothetical protein